MVVYYKYFFHERSRFNDREGMVYSCLIYQSLDNPEYFNRDSGKLDISIVKAFIAKALIETGKESIEYDDAKINKSEIAKQTGIARSTVYDICDKFIEGKIIDGNTIQCPPELLDEHYFELPELPPSVRLTFQQRLFYGFLKNRARSYNGIIDTKEYMLASLFGKKKEDIKTLLAALKRNNLTERLSDGRLKIK